MSKLQLPDNILDLIAGGAISIHGSQVESIEIEGEDLVCLTSDGKKYACMMVDKGGIQDAAWYKDYFESDFFQTQKVDMTPMMKQID